MSANQLKTGDRAPDFTLMNQDGKETRLSGFAGKNVVLYFYPKDNTSGCTVEAIDFTARKKEFESFNTVIVGVSPDSVKSHCNFIAKQDLGIMLASDPHHTALEQYGAWGTKKMYGKEYIGVIRSTVLIDVEGTVVQSWYKVKVSGHADEVLDAVKNLQ